jgi:predicted phage terminase large subunit-like protein
MWKWIMSDVVKKSVNEWLNGVDYSENEHYIPSQFALEFVTFIKLVNGNKGEENKTPVLHYKMLDQIAGKKKDITNMIHRGAAKTTIMGEYLFLYLAIYGGIPGFGKIPLAIYVSDSIENGVKNMRKNLEYRWENSEFLQKYIPNTRFTDVRYEFTNIEGETLVVKGYGAKTGVRGAKEMGQRPYLAVLDDLVSDEDARSATVIASIEDTVYKAIDYALHPTRRKTIWSGTPFNAKDPLYKAVESGAWYANVYPVCEKFPCTREEFRGSWEDRFDYDYVKAQYNKAMKVGKIDTFNQEMMLRIMSDEDRLVQDDDIVWYSREEVLKSKSRYNFYVTTDFSFSEKQSADYSVIMVWAYNSNGDWLLVDGAAERRLIDKSLDDLFRFVSIYKPLNVGIEITGQQVALISWLRQQMIDRNIYFNLAKEENSNQEGLRPTTNKMTRFQNVIPLFKSKKIWLPKETVESKLMVELLDELQNAAVSGFKSKHDDAIDCISMVARMQAWKPSEEVQYELTQSNGSGMWVELEDDTESYDRSTIF